ncbi:hypothetical protein OUZ56_005874 [Daphnia magna]|uniref:Uncharacterized protein n=1 Tax=Daphnia magna TaxID=35525 RepID=A0ABQ9YU09_9CRUS|nr:hypothetical protein OUZ56_005874 [Daphnia magna]
MERIPSTVSRHIHVDSRLDQDFKCVDEFGIGFLSIMLFMMPIVSINDKLGSEKVPWLGRDTE